MNWNYSKDVLAIGEIYYESLTFGDMASGQSGPWYSILLSTTKYTLYKNLKAIDNRLQEKASGNYEPRFSLISLSGSGT